MDSPPTYGEAHQEYGYEQLERNTIRGFRIQSTENFDEEVCGEIVNIKLTSEGPSLRYNALSYCWGPTYPDGSHLSEAIQCNGKILSVTPGLKTALKYIRSVGRRTDHKPVSSKGTLLWIDAICINQMDLYERSSQVSLMALIYRHSSRVIVWLGELDATVQRPVMSSYTQVLPVHDAAESWRRKVVSRLRSRKQLPETPEQPLMRTAAPMQSMIYSSDLLEWVMERPWFKRRWVLQELFYAQECDMFIGDFVCSREKMRELINVHSDLRRAPPLQNHDIDCSLLEACWKFDASQCSDPRDCVFALRQMSREGEQIEVDYGVSVRDTYLQMLIDTVLVFDEAHKYQRTGERSGPSTSYNVKILQMFAIASCKQVTDPSFETWMPDWRLGTKYTSPSHQTTVEMCLSKRFQHKPHGDAFWSLPSQLDFDFSGHCYLKVRSRLLRYSDPPLRLCGGYTSTSDGADSDHDLIWVPYLRPQKSGIAFLLRKGRTQVMHRDRPVCRLDFCFTVEYHEERYEARQFGSDGSSACWVGLPGLETAQEKEFYLE